MGSGRGTGDDSNMEEVIIYRCRKCPQMTFEDVAEREVHRAYHIQQDAEREAAERSNRQRTSDSSDATLFEVPDQEQHASQGEKRTSEEAQGSSPPAKKRSRKWYNGTLIGGWKKGLGA